MAIRLVRGSILENLVPLLMVPTRYLNLISALKHRTFFPGSINDKSLYSAETSLGPKSKFWDLEYLDW